MDVECHGRCRHDGTIRCDACASTGADSKSGSGAYRPHSQTHRTFSGSNGSDTEAATCASCAAQTLTNDAHVRSRETPVSDRPRTIRTRGR